MASFALTPVQIVDIFGGQAILVNDRNLRDHIIRKAQLCFNISTKLMMFPGPQPSSLMRYQLSNLSQTEYIVTDKTDGDRYLLFYTINDQTPLVCIINRMLQVWIVPGCSASSYLFMDTLLDGEIVKCHDGQWKYIAFDLVKSRGVSMMQYSYADRLKILITLAKHMSWSEDDGLQCPFSLQVKNFIQCGQGQINSFASQHIPQLPYETDGFIFTPNRCPIQSGTHLKMFKWKPQHLNTFDLLVKVEYLDKTIKLFGLGKSQNDQGKSDNEFVMVSHQPMHPSLERMGFESKVHVERLLSQVDNKIVECGFNIPTNTFVIIKVRNKAMPNTVSVIQKTIQNITENITFDDIVQADSLIC